MVNVSGSSLMSSFNFISKYAKYDPELKRRETFEEAVDRMVDMHIEKYLAHPNSGCWSHGASPTMWKIRNEIEAAFQLVKEKRLLASQRTLQFGGPGILKHNFRNYNCSTTYVDRPRVFAEIEYLLLCGCGVGFSVQKHHVDKLPPLVNKEDWDNRRKVMFVIPDTIEGWADAFDILVSSYLIGTEYNWANIIFDYSEIRPQGAPLSTGGKAPGPEPLRHALEMVRNVLQRAVDARQERLRPIDCHDIICHMSDSVLAGGVRRSALISLFSPDDEEMMNAKTGDWYIKEPQRARANNSAILLREKTSKELFLRLFESTKQFGEPGFIFANTLESTFNPCSEINLYPLLIRDQEGNVCDSYTIDMLNNQQKYKDLGYTYESGVAVCNLCEINGAAIKNREDFEEVVTAAAIIGTLQAGYTEPGYLTRVSKDIVEREALLGISITGMMDNPDICFDEDLLNEMAALACSVNQKWAETLGIRPAARVTCVKPAGNSTILLGCQGSGIHPPHSRRLIRRVQTNKFDPIYQEFKLINPHMCEESVWSANKADDVISFPVETHENAITKDDITALEFLEMVKSVQSSWVLSGTARPDSVQGAEHNVSNTVAVGPDEWDAVADFIWDNREYFSGISLIAKSGDFVYEQAPMQKIWLESELVEQFGKTNVGAAKHVRRFLDDEFGHVRHIMAALKRVLEGEDTRHIFNVERGLKGAFLTPEHLFAKHKSDMLWEAYIRIRQLIHLENVDDIITLLAAIGHEEEWNRLTRDMVEIDYSMMSEEEDNTKQLDNLACAGGQCEISFEVEEKRV